MTYIYAWFGALTGCAFCYGCMLGTMIPPGLRPTPLARPLACEIREIPDESPADRVVALPRRVAPRVSLVRPTPVPETGVPTTLPLAA